ncbi:limonene hydroxylase [Paenibacillus alvei]|uniref:limonene hydroxylase n=1 Tax=Paenibacillus alvei TaxID=44250 RepID=UPI0018CF57E9|nr:limonene hydroxylase [Paenibacillus alvei]MBG9734917.1 limonene hydroxylase [Paenibacillus alvei]MBG9744792.1 limonene hydroxylase [Paenibacillus alvei]MCY9578776.1 limonene hydroxylase [Paenibacillus alvei]MCY9583832.1 limonene hydroxylase [Paenibacillus alvei]
MIISFDQAAPWKGRPSIYAYIRDQGELIDGSLPDDEEFWADSKIRWVAGGLDGVCSHHGAGSDRKGEVDEIVQLLGQQSRKPKHATRKALYMKLVTAEISSMIDNILEQARIYPGIRPEPVFQEAVWFAEHGAHRNVVKFGIALLGLFHNEHVKELLLTLGKHDEFTLYTAVAIQNGVENSNEVLFALAKQVHGWGKIHLVERLEPSTQEIRDWLLRHGCQNHVMNEYLACICARNGGLQEALSAGQVDRELFDGATDIIEALLNGGPAEDIDDYEHAPQVLSNYVRAAHEMCFTVKHLSVMFQLQDFLTQDEERWSERMAAGWTEQLRINTLVAVQTVIAQPRWNRIVMDVIESGDTANHYYGIACAEKIGIDIWEILYQQLAEDPLQDSHYLQLMKSEDSSRIQKLVQFAEEHLPLQHIATGPGDEMGLGKAYIAHQCLDSILQSLDRFNGIGERLITVGLHSPVVRNRNMALRALEGWDAALWSAQLIGAVIHLSEIETEEAVKERIQALREAKGI